MRQSRKPHAIMLGKANDQDGPNHSLLPAAHARGLYDEIFPMSGRFRSLSVQPQKSTKTRFDQSQSSLAHSLKRLPKGLAHIVELLSQLIDLVLQEFCWNPLCKKRFPISG